MHVWVQKERETVAETQKEISGEKKERGLLRGTAMKSRGLEEYSVIYIYTFWSPQIPTLIKRNQLKLSSFNVYLN